MEAPSQTWVYRPRSGEEPETPLRFHARTPHAWAPCWALRSGWCRPSGNGTHSRGAHMLPTPPHDSQPPGPGGQVTGGNVTDSRRCRRPTLRPPGDSGPTTDAERGGTSGHLPPVGQLRTRRVRGATLTSPTNSVGYSANHPPTGPAPRLPELSAGRVPGRGRVSQADTWAARWMCFWREAGLCSQRAASRGQQLPDLGPGLLPPDPPWRKRVEGRLGAREPPSHRSLGLRVRVWRMEKVPTVLGTEA